MDVTIRPWPRVSGRVIDEDGKPVRNFRLRLTVGIGFEDYQSSEAEIENVVVTEPDANYDVTVTWNCWDQDECTFECRLHIGEEYPEYTSCNENGEQLDLDPMHMYFFNIRATDLAGNQKVETPMISTFP